MLTKKAIRAVAVTGSALALLLAASAQAQERKSIRWSTSSVDSYGYKVAAAMVKIAEEALGGEYTITVQKSNGEKAYIVGGLISDVVVNPWNTAITNLSN